MSQSRLTRLRKAMGMKCLEALFITSAVNRRYMTGFTGSSGYVLVTQERAVLMTDFRYMTQAPQQAADFEVIEHDSKMTDTLKQLLSEMDVRRLGIEQDDVSFATYSGYQSQLEAVELIPVSGMIEVLRMIKDEGELAILREAA